MKKLMIAAAIVCAAAFANAAAINWSTGALKTADKDGKWTSTALYGNYESLAITAYLYSDAAGTTLLGTGSSSSVLPTSMATGSFKNGGTAVSVDNGSTYYVKIVMTADFGNGDTQTFQNNSIVAYTMPSKGTGSANFATLGVINTSSSSAQWSAVPEPTSAMLLLLGVAGLALKRKRA